MMRMISRDDGDGDDCKDEYDVMTMIHVADYGFRVSMKDMAIADVRHSVVGDGHHDDDDAM